MVNYKDYTQPEYLKKKKVETPPVENKVSIPQSVAPNGIPKDATPSKSSSSSNKREGAIKVLRDTDTGKMTGVITPDGRTLQGLSSREVDFLARKYAGQTTAPAGTVFADEEATIQRDAEKLNTQQEILSQQSAVDMSKLNNPILAGLSAGTPEEIAQSQSMEAEILRRQEIDNRLNKIPIVNVAGKIIGAGIKTLNKYVPGAGSATLSELDNVPAIKNYLNDYSNEDTYKSVENDIKNAKDRIKDAISLANAGNIDLSIEAYNNAVGQLKRSERILKALEKDQKSYVSDVRISRTNLLYELDNIDKIYGVEMSNAIRKNLLEQG